MEEGVSEIVESTRGVVRALEGLYSEHRSIMIAEGLGRAEREGGLSELYAAAEKEVKRRESGERSEEEEEEEEEFSIELRGRKQAVLEESLEKLQSGIGEATLMLMLASYVNSLEGDKQKLRAQVKRLCAENNWLRTELTSHQQLLQDTEVQMAKIKEDKEQLEFLLAQSRPGGSSGDSAPLPHPPRDQSPSMDIQEEESEDVTAMGVSGSAASGQGGGAGDYEVPEKIKTLHHLVLQYVNQGKPDIAVPLCKKAVKDLERKKGKDDPDVASMLNILAVIYREQGKLKEATHVLQDTLEIREKVFGPAHPAVASTLNNLSVLYGKSGDYRTAEPYCKRALEIRQKLLGTNHPDVAKQFTNLAILCSHLGKYDEVEYYYQRAVEIYQTELGPDDPNVSKTMNNLAQCYLKQGKLQAAESIFKKVLTTVQTRETGGEEMPHPPSQASWVLANTDMPSSAPESPYKAVHEEPYNDHGGWHKSVPVDSPTVSSTLRNLSTVYREQGRTNTAEELDRFTQENDLGPAQQARMAELLEAEKSSDRPSSPSKQQAGRQRQSSRPFLAKSVKMLLGWQSNTPKQPGEEQQGGAA